MNFILLLVAVILIACVFASKISSKLGIPILLLFIALGMLCGSDGLLGIEFSDYTITEQISTIALIIIMFYGGFGTNWKAARPVALKAGLMSSFGVVITAGIVGLFCYFIMQMSLLEGLLIGSVIGSTDAASVFSILRSKSLNLKHGLASLLEIESGSNDPIAYMLTITILSIMSGTATGGNMILNVLAQLGFGLLCGGAIALAARYVFKKITFDLNGIYPIFVIAVALAAFALASLLGGNGFLSVYLVGIILGNSHLPDEGQLVHFFDGVTWIMQILLFFMLGLLSFPSRMIHSLIPAVIIFLFLSFIARPIATGLILTPFRVPWRDQALISWAGLRGAASIVFAIYAMVSDADPGFDIFHIVFCVCLLSVLFQGTLLPLLARKLRLVDERENVFKTFNGYQEENSLNLVEIHLSPKHPWIGAQISELALAKRSLVVMIKRGEDIVIPSGNTLLEEHDILVVSMQSYQGDADVRLFEVRVGKGHAWSEKKIEEISLPDDTLIVMIRRGEDVITPKGHTKILAGDVLVLNDAHTHHFKGRFS